MSITGSKVYDIVVVGGGMVGAALALALKDTSLSVAVIERSMPAAFTPGQPHDLRVSALNHSSEAFLSELDVWKTLLSWRACPYTKMKVWELDETLASTLFDAQEINQPYLGHIVENRLIQRALLDALDIPSNIELISPATISGIDYSAGANIVSLDDGRDIVGRLLIGADGAMSNVRQAANIGVHRWDYEQGALVTTVETDFEQLDITWQQFKPTGPVALLPLNGNRASLVWYDSPTKLKALMALSDEAFLQKVTANFPDALGPLVRVIGRGWFPLARQHAQAYVKEGVALIGDSAHTINPLAGQGVNIGLLDAQVLAKEIILALESGQDIASLAVLKRYEGKRRWHNRMMMQTMDAFYHVFSNRNPALTALRNFGLGMAGRLPLGRKLAIRVAMGEVSVSLPHWLPKS